MDPEEFKKWKRFKQGDSLARDHGNQHLFPNGFNANSQGAEPVLPPSRVFDELPGFRGFDDLECREFYMPFGKK
jgi:hypothetical protein